MALAPSPNRAYGAAATGWAQRLLPSTPIVTTDLEAVPTAFFEAARRRKRGEYFSASIVIEDARARCALYRAAPLVLAQVSDYDERARTLDAVAKGTLIIDGRTQADSERYEPHQLRSGAEFLVTADVVVVRSSVEREALSRLLGRRFLHVAELAPLDPTIPAFNGSREEPQAIAVWAPDYPAEACGIIAYALEEFVRPAFIICAAGKPAPMRPGTRFVSLGDAAWVLARAAVIVDASLADPGSARALARWGVPLAVASCSGAADWLNGVPIYDPWDHRSVQTAIANALGSRAPYERRPNSDSDEEHARVLAQAIPPARPGGPLVSVIVPTLNRRTSLWATIASVAAQTYDNVELVLVNDGGPPIDRQAVEGPMRVNVVECAQQRGVESALNVGIEAARGKYITLVADDDLFFPDHVAQLVEPLERIGGDVAHSIELREKSELAADGSYATAGYSLMVGEPATKTALQIATVIGGPSIMFTRSAYDAGGGFDHRAGNVSDLEMWMRLSERFDFLHVDRVTAMMSCRNDPSQISSVTGTEFGARLRYIYGLHPTSRQSVANARQNFINHVEKTSC